MASPSEIGRAIKAARKQRGLSQRALAEQLDVHPNRISIWENGRFVRIEDDNRVALSRRLDIDPVDLETDAATDREALLQRLDELEDAYAHAIAEVAETQRVIQHQLHRIQQGLELHGIQLPRDVARPSAP